MTVSGKVEEFLPFYEEALLFMDLSRILPDNKFTKNRLALIGRDLAISIYLAMHDMYEEAQFLLRQILDLVYIILYGANHHLELKLLDEGKIDLMRNIRDDVNKRFPAEIKTKLNSFYRKLSCVVHGTVKDILTQVVTVKENWENPGKLGHWQHDFHLTLHYSVCLYRCWLPHQYAKLDVSLRADLDKNFPKLKTFEKDNTQF